MRRHVAITAHTLNCRVFRDAGVKYLGRTGFCGAQDAGVKNIAGCFAGASNLLGSRLAKKTELTRYAACFMHNYAKRPNMSYNKPLFVRIKVEAHLSFYMQNHEPEVLGSCFI
eukprot:6199303-Pleurochrysis_carterae.AAC.1